MGESSKFVKTVLALLAAFALFCTGWHLSRASLPEPYRVTTGQRPPVEEDGAMDETNETDSSIWEDTRPESLLPGETINVNTADVYDLQRLPGIGERRALDVIAYREEHGPFQSVDELTNVSGIGPGILEGLREYASVE